MTTHLIPTAADLLAEAATIAQDVALVAGMTAQQKLRGLVFDPMEPLPDLHCTRAAASWEPAARRFKDLTEEEKVTP